MGSTQKRSVSFGDEPSPATRRVSESGEANKPAVPSSSSGDTPEFANAQVTCQASPLLWPSRLISWAVCPMLIVDSPTSHFCTFREYQLCRVIMLHFADSIPFLDRDADVLCGKDWFPESQFPEQELLVGSKTLGNMLSSGRFAVVSVKDVRNSLRGRISAPAAFEEAGPAASPERPADEQPPPAAPEAFPSSRTWPPDAGGRSPQPAQPRPEDTPRAGPGEPTPPAEPVGAPEAAADAAADPERPSAFARLSGEALPPAEPEPHSGAYPQIETNVTRSGRLAADDQLEIDKNSSTELIISQMKHDAAASRRRARPPGVPGLQLHTAHANGRDTESDRVPIASAVIAPSNVKPLPSPFSLEGGSQPLTQDSPQAAQSGMEGNAEKEESPDAQLHSTSDDSAHVEEKSDAPLPLGELSPAPQVDMQSSSTPQSYDRHESRPMPPLS